MHLRTKRPLALLPLIAPLILALLLAGQSPSADAQNPGSNLRYKGTSIAHKAGGKKVASKQVASVETRWIGIPAAEPTLGLNDDETIFYTAANINALNSVEIIKSDDRGATWENISPDLGPRNRHAVTLDPYIYVDKWTGRVFDIDLTVACSLLSYTDDAGELWVTNPVACGRPVNDHQTLFSGPPVTTPMTAYENIVYYCWNDVATSSCSKSIDGGISFHPAGTPAYFGYSDSEEEESLCGGLHGHGVVGEDGTVYLPRNYCGRPMLAISHDEGLTWEQVQVAPRTGGGLDNSVAVDAKGNVYYVFTDRTRLPYLVVSKDGGETWGPPMAIGAPGLKESNIVTIDVGAPGKIALAYMGSTDSPFQKCRKTEEGCESSDWAKASWNGFVTVTDQALEKDPVFHTVLTDEANDPLKRMTCGPRRCGTTIFDFIDVVVGPDGSAYVATVDACTLICAQGAGDSGNEGHMTIVSGIKLR